MIEQDTQARSPARRILTPMVRFDPLFLAYLTSAALLVITPGAATAVVIKNAVEGGRPAAFVTSVGITFANSTWAVASCAGLSVLVTRAPFVLPVLKWIGGGYLALLGAQSLWQAGRRRATDPSTQTPDPVGHRPPSVAPVAGYATQGAVTNLLNPAAAVFYVSYVPQFIRSTDPFVTTYLFLAAIHVVMAFTCHNMYGLTIGGFAAAMSKPRVKRALEMVTGAALVALGASVALRS